MENQTDTEEISVSLRSKPSMTILKAFRLSNGWSLQDIEKRGYNKYTYSHIESGKRKTSRKMQIVIGDMFKVRPHFLFDQYGYAIKFSHKDILSLAMMKRRKVIE